MATARIPQWALSKDQQKRALEHHFRTFLNPKTRDLASHERFFLAESIAAAFRGQFGMARDALRDAYEDAGQFVNYAMDPEVVAKATSSNLRRAFSYLESTPAQEHPIFS